MSVFGIILVRIRENADQNNSEYGHFLHRVEFEISPLFGLCVNKKYIDKPIVIYGNCATNMAQY